jgi:hypothetical protein
MPTVLGAELSEQIGDMRPDMPVILIWEYFYPPTRHENDQQVRLQLL